MKTPQEQIPAAQCWELLATAAIGRLALSVHALPVIVPVQYIAAGHRLAVCLGHRAIPERSLDGTIVAFTADAIDPAARAGWSVQVQGRSSISRYDSFGIACDQPTAGQIIEIEARNVTGYYVHLCPLIDTLLGNRQVRA